MVASLVAELVVRSDGSDSQVCAIGPHALFVGRAPDNDLVLRDIHVSGRHAVFHYTADRTGLLLRDLGSTNGTFVGGLRVRDATPLRDGDEIRLADAVHLRVRLRTTDEPVPPSPPPTLLVDLDADVATPVRGRVFRVGSDPGCDLRLAEGPPLVASIALHEGGEILVGTDDGEFGVVPGEPFSLGDRTLVFRHGPHAVESTARHPGRDDAFPYRLTVHMDVAGRSEAEVRDLVEDRVHVVTADNRVALLYVLASRRARNLGEGVSPERAGWCTDEEVMRGVWGRSWEDMDANNYQVLLSRLRRELTGGGFDGWFIEKRRGHTRVRLDDIRLE